MTKRTPDSLCDRREKFVLEYLVDLNGKEAAIRAGYSPGRATAEAHELLKDPAIKARVDVAIRERNERVKVDADNVVRELVRMALYDVGDIAKANIQTVKQIESLEANVRGAIVGWKWDADDRLVLKLANKQAALETLTKHVLVRDLFPQRLEVSGPGGGDIPMGNTELANRVLSLLTTLEKRAKAALSDGKPAGS
jgi:phage terminase small subunit